jgi:hypothetical protein
MKAQQMAPPASKQSFPDVVSILNNPFQKSHLNFAVKNQQAIITPKMAAEMRSQQFHSREIPSKNTNKVGS